MSGLPGKWYKPVLRRLIVTGARGFLGAELVRLATEMVPGAEVIPVVSPVSGGVDLTQPQARGWLREHLRFEDAERTALIHAAAVVAFDAAEGLLANAAMATNLALWAREAGLGFSTLISSVSAVGKERMAGSGEPAVPENLYAIGKRTAEQVWRLLLPWERSTIVRLAGVWGWQRMPSLFWNQLLLAGAGLGNGPLTVRRSRSRRNYISVAEAARCVLQVTAGQMPGVFVAAGRDILNTASFVQALQAFPDCRLQVRWEDDGLSDESVYEPSLELRPSLRPFPEMLQRIWHNKPNWTHSQ